VQVGEGVEGPNPIRFRAREKKGKNEKKIDGKGGRRGKGREKLIAVTTVQITQGEMEEGNSPQ